jgi:hypothetical protein
MAEREEQRIQATCPCCGATLVVDAGGAVTEWKEARDPRRAAELRDAERVLREEKERVEARYREIVRTEKEKGAAMDRKFQEFLEKSQGQAPEKPLRDVDLD